MPIVPAVWPYKRPFYNITLSEAEIQEDFAIIISGTKRRPRKNSPPAGSDYNRGN